MIDFIDKTGTPRSDEEIMEAMVAVKKAMIGPMSPLTLYYLTILDGLRELLQRRKYERDVSTSALSASEQGGDIEDSR